MAWGEQQKTLPSPTQRSSLPQEDNRLPPIRESLVRHASAAEQSTGVASQSTPAVVTSVPPNLPHPGEAEMFSAGDPFIYHMPPSNWVSTISSQELEVAIGKTPYPKFPCAYCKMNFLSMAACVPHVNQGCEKDFESRTNGWRGQPQQSSTSDSRHGYVPGSRRNGFDPPAISLDEAQGHPQIQQQSVETSQSQGMMPPEINIEPKPVSRQNSFEPPTRSFNPDGLTPHDRKYL